MNRTRVRVPAVDSALAVIPPAIRRLCEPDWLIGCDPIFTGLCHGYPAMEDSRSYRCTAHVCYPWHTHDKTTTVVLPHETEPHVVIHEWAHALHHTLGFHYTPGPQPPTRAVTVTRRLLRRSRRGSAHTSPASRKASAGGTTGRVTTPAPRTTWQPTTRRSSSSRHSPRNQSPWRSTMMHITMTCPACNTRDKAVGNPHEHDFGRSGKWHCFQCGKGGDYTVVAAIAESSGE